jgi:predicted MFS family arabinose efflux permease
VSRPARGAVLVLACAVILVGVAMGALFSLAVLLEPLERSMGWSRASLGAINLLNWIVMGVGSLAAGRAFDRLGARPVVAAGGALLGLGLVLSSRAEALWQFYLSFGVLVAAGASAFLVPLTVTVMRWWEARRALASALVSGGIGLGIMAFSPLTRWLVDVADWRLAALVLGDLAWLLVLPLAVLVREPDAAPAAASVPTDGRAARAALWRAWPLWGLAATHFACCAAHSGPIFHMVSHAIDLGVAKLAAASLLGVSGVASILSRIGAGMLADRLGPRETLVGALGFQSVVIFLYLFASDLGTLSVLGVFFGMAYGGAMPLYPVVARAYFGEQVMGTAYGAVFFISCIGMGLGAYAGGAIHGALGSYTVLFLGSAAIGGVAAAAALSLRPPMARRAVLA